MSTSHQQLQLLDMISKIYPSSSHDSKSRELEQQFAAQKEQMYRSKVENDAFFNRINQLFAQNLEMERMKAELLHTAQQLGLDSLPQALNRVQNEHGYSPLQQAFQAQNFPLAKKLIDWGADVGPIERATFEIALDSKKAKEEYGTIPVTEKKYPAVKHFGLTLGIEMTAADGTYSQIAHIAPTYKIMTDSLSSYANNNPHNKDIGKIAEAFSFSNNAGQFTRSTSMNPRAGEQITDRIQEGKITTIPIACKGHFMGLSIVPDGPGSKSGYMVFTNRGLGCNEKDCGTQIYRVDDLKKMNPQMVTAMMNGLSNGTSHEDIMKIVHQVADHKSPISTIPQQPQKYDNCSIANTRANIRGILLCQQAIAKNGFNNLNEQDLSEVKTRYKEYSNAMRVEKVHELIKELGKNPKDPDLINIGKEYLKQHPKVESSVREKLETAMDSARKAAQGKQDHEPPQLSIPK